MQASGNAKASLPKSINQTDTQQSIGRSASQVREAKDFIIKGSGNN
jgi:hypothetical protein